MIYIGKHQTDNINDNYMGSGLRIKRAIEKYGLNNFEKTILFECSSEEEMNQKEAEIVNEEFISRDDVYNIMLGGYGGFGEINKNPNNNGAAQFFKGKTSEEIKEISRKGALQRQKNESMMSDEEKQKRAQHKRELAYSSGFNKYFSGRRHSSTTKQKIGKKLSTIMKGESNFMRGKSWIKNSKTHESKLHPKNEPIPDGWVPGRFIKI